MEPTIFQNYIFAEFILPFLLIFAITFALLEKSKILGDSNKQVNAIVSFVVGLIFVGAVFPKAVVNDLILFLTVALVVMFVFLLLYGFVASDMKEGLKPELWMKWVFGLLAAVGIVAVLVWSTGSDFFLFNFLFYQSWSKSFWTNVVFVAFVIAAIVAVLKSGKK